MLVMVAKERVVAAVAEWSSFLRCTPEARFDSRECRDVDSVSGNQSLTISRCKNGASKYGEDRNQRVPSVSDV